MTPAMPKGKKVGKMLIVEKNWEFYQTSSSLQEYNGSNSTIWCL
jgi:hypothetical protein